MAGELQAEAAPQLQDLEASRLRISAVNSSQADPSRLACQEHQQQVETVRLGSIEASEKTTNASRNVQNTRARIDQILEVCTVMNGGMWENLV